MSLQNENPSGSNRHHRKRIRPTKSVDFCKIGGLSNHLSTLREVIIFPLIHGNVFVHFNIKAPRGILFYGPPGTGKTLVAAALVTELNKEGIGKVAFFHRKGADILDKWVGGSEKNLRDLFEKASKSRPAIIFFDELDGLAPIREKQIDQVHSSVVATLLALMDGLDNKPGLIVIGATNRIEAIDPALRRPGRFDKELYFPLPGIEARTEILQVHTGTWKNKPSPELLAQLVEATSGFSGADLQALCSEALLRCMKRTFPHLDRIAINPDELEVEECDFLNARLSIIPSSLKGGNIMRKLSPIVKPLLEEQLKKIMRSVQTFWPHFLQENYKYIIGEERYTGRVLLTGTNMQGLNTHLVPAILQHLEYLPTVIYDVTKFFAKNMQSNVQNNFPSIILLSRIDEWWNLIDECEQLSIASILDDIHAGLPKLVIATCKTDIPPMLHDFFYNNSSILLKIENPTEEERKRFFRPLFFDRSIISLLTVLENSRRMLLHEKPLKSERSRRSSQSKKANVKLSDNINYMLRRNKRKRDFYPIPSVPRKKTKRIKSSDELVRSSSFESLYDIHNQMKHERRSDNKARKCDSLTCIGLIQDENCFAQILSELLKQRNSRCCDEDSNASSSIKASLCDSQVDSSSTSQQSDISSKDAQFQRIYQIWKHTSLVTSRNMAVAQLELLYDVISACISIHWNSFESSLKNLEGILKSIEKSNKPRKVERN